MLFVKGLGEGKGSRKGIVVDKWLQAEVLSFFLSLFFNNFLVNVNKCDVQKHFTACKARKQKVVLNNLLKINLFLYFGCNFLQFFIW